jgi:NAD-dependent SIR2 family protein deacetylase
VSSTDNALPHSDRPRADALPAGQIEALWSFIERHDNLLVLTGAGVSTASGIPDYRDADGTWKRGSPMQYRDFIGSAAKRQRYWARSMVGWARVGQAQPNPAHRALAALEASGHIAHLVTQNVDRLHQRAGSERVIDLHGRLDRVACLGCAHDLSRDDYQSRLEADNPDWRFTAEAATPDGDVELVDVDYAAFVVPPCPACGGVLKPQVVFFGESIPRAVSERAADALAAADALLVIGSSLMVFSGFRFARTMAQRGRPVAAINRGKTRADDLIGLKLDGDIGQTLGAVLRHSVGS